MTVVNELDRYNRQELIPGWDQQKLRDATVTIVGSDALAQHTAIPLVALGVGYVRIVDNQPARGDGFLDFYLEGESRVRAMEEALNIINPGVDVRGVSSPLVSDASKYFLEGSDIIVEATNDPRSKAIAVDYAQEKGIPLLTTSAKQYYGKLLLNNNDGRDLRYLLPEFQGEKQDESVSFLLGGLITEEVKRILMQGSDWLEVPIYYNLTHPERFTFENGKKIAAPKNKEFAGSSALVVGAGALGEKVATGLVKLGVGRVDSIDHDTVDDTNVNRQIIYYDRIGQLKSPALAEKNRKISRGLTESEGIVETFTEKIKLKRDYDLILDCVDNFTVSAVISDYAIEHKIPLIAGGTDYQAGQVAIYVPGKTSCMDCQMDIHRLGREAEDRRRAAGCLAAPNPSVIMSNQIIAAIMINESRTVLSPRKYGKPINGKLKFGSDLENRLGVTPIESVCNCEPKGGFVIEPQRVHIQEVFEEDPEDFAAVPLALDEPTIPLPEDKVENEDHGITLEDDILRELMGGD